MTWRDAASRGFFCVHAFSRRCAPEFWHAVFRHDFFPVGFVQDAVGLYYQYRDKVLGPIFWYNIWYCKLSAALCLQIQLLHVQIEFAKGRYSKKKRGCASIFFWPLVRVREHGTCTCKSKKKTEVYLRRNKFSTVQKLFSKPHNWYFCRPDNPYPPSLFVDVTEITV